MEKKVSLKDVAKYADVSPSTVSRYMNNPTSVNNLKGFRINKAIEELQYVPNPIARSLKVGHTNMIGVIIPAMNSYFSKLCLAISDFFYKHGYLVFFCQSGENGEKEQYYLEQMSNMGFAGILLAAITTQPETILNLSSTTEIVLFDRTIKADIDSISEDNEKLGADITEYVTSLGYKNILGLFGSSKSLHAISRLNGAQSVIDKRSDINFVSHMDCYDIDELYSAIKGRKDNMPDAIIAYGFIVTENVISVLNSLDIKINDDVFLACWALPDFRTKYRFKVPYIEENPYDIGLAASDMLIKRIENKNKNAKHKSVIYSAKLIKI